MIKKFGLAALLSVLATTSSAEFYENVPKLAAGTTVSDVASLDVKSMKAIKTDDGQVTFMSENGRYIVKGQIYDVWQGKTIDTIAEIKYANTHINLKGVAYDSLPLNDLKVGEGEKVVTVFVDPNCDYCKKLIKKAQKLSDEYTFRFIVVPALGGESDELSKRVACAKDKSSAINMMLHGRLLELEQKKNCDLKAFDMTLLVATLVGVDAIPFLVAPDGRFMRGAPGNLVGWIENK